ncbi:MAG: LytTR family DNA-binding domain-containing protein [Pseudomonadota bacterium]
MAHTPLPAGATPVKVLVVEDEPMVARRLARMLSALLPQDVVIERCDELSQAVHALRGTRYDALFLDLNLAGEDGFALLRKALVGPHETIVVSANTDRAMEAFEHGVLDFVPKPFDEARLGKAVARLQRQASRTGPAVKQLAVQTGRETRAVPVAQVRAIHGAGNYAELELLTGRRLLHAKTLDQLAELLPDEFLRIHRSHIVNLNTISSLRTLEGSRYRVVFEDGRELPVSRQRVRELRQRLA